MNYLSYSGVFLEGLLSFVSPCILPLIPLYMAYLSGEKEEGEGEKKQLKIFINTLFFLLGISTVFILLAFSLSSIGTYLNDYRDIIGIIGGTLVIIFGLHMSGLIEISVLNYEKRFSLPKTGSQILNSFLLGFVFSFAWTPCLGPMISEVIFLCISDGFNILYLFVYLAGLLIPFLITGLFTDKILSLLKREGNRVRYVSIVCAVILMLYGAYMIHTASVNILNYRNAKTETAEKNDYIYLDEYELYDQDGNPVKLSDYKGKYVFLNFSATWCTYCYQEIPEYLEFAEDSDAVCFYVMSPQVCKTGVDEIREYAKNNEISIPILIDEDNALTALTGVSAYPTAFVVGPDLSFVAYYSGACDKDTFDYLYSFAAEKFESR